MMDLYVLKEKSRTMKFDFSKSTEADFRNKLQSDLDILMSNVLYMTHEIDQIKKVVISIENSYKLQTQVDDYFDDKPKDIPEVEND